MRRKRAETRSTIPDPRYNSMVLAKFVNNLMERGKKSLATRIVYEALDVCADRTKRPAMEVFDDALKNAKKKNKQNHKIKGERELNKREVSKKRSKTTDKRLTRR
jgi:ribosomal protein S7